MSRWIQEQQLWLIWFYVLCCVFVLHLFANILFRFSLTISRIFNQIESVMVFIAISILSLLGLSKVISWITNHDVVLSLVSDFADADTWRIVLYLLFILCISLMGYLVDLNALSFHRFYRSQLSSAFLHYEDVGDYRRMLVQEMFNAFGRDDRDFRAPYPLINTCLNLQVIDGKDDKFKGVKAYDYFLLSPLFFGSKLTKYLPSNYFKDYRQMTLPAAMTISAAAVNPGMGQYSNKILSILMTIFNARFGFWISNPLKYDSPRRVWWPWYFLHELLSQIGTSKRKLNISDGGHIENLGVYELLRRKCRLIIAIDAGADPRYSFSELEILTVRARNELGIEIEFKEGQVPEDIIRPKPSHGYSQRRFAVADVYQIWEEVESRGNIKDRDYHALEVIINYHDLKESLKKLNFEGRLLVRMIYSVITAFDASELLENELKGLVIENENIVKNMLRAEIFSEHLDARRPCILKVLKDAMLREPDQMKRLLKEVGLLNRAYKNHWRLPERFVSDLVDHRLEPKIVEIERALLDLLDGPTIRQAYQVMKSILRLLNHVRARIELKLGKEFLMRKMEDEVLKNLLKNKNIDHAIIDQQFAEEPSDQKLSDWMKEAGMAKRAVNDLMGERNRIRQLLSMPLSEEEMKDQLEQLKLDQMSVQGGLALKKLN
ncbi:MAG: hypothetical protein AAGD05_14620, partial [Bacteroidota bacterium]